MHLFSCRLLSFRILKLADLTFINFRMDSKSPIGNNILKLQIQSGDNIEYFLVSNSKSNSSLIHELKRIIEISNELENLIKNVASFYHEYDFDEKTPLNGYRSMEVVANEAFKYCLRKVRYIQERRRNFWFPKKVATKSVLINLNTI